MRIEAVCIAGADLPEPHLRVRKTREQAIRSNDFVPIHLVSTGLYVDEDKLAFVVWFEAKNDLALVDLISAPGELFSAVTGSYRHQTLLLYVPPSLYRTRRPSPQSPGFQPGGQRRRMRGTEQLGNEIEPSLNITVKFFAMIPVASERRVDLL